MLLRAVWNVTAPLIGLVIVTLGNGLFNTLLAVRLHAEGASSWLIGAVSGAYYAGLVFGAFNIERFIVRVGHIRAYAAFASVLAAVTLLQGLWLSPAIWILLRVIGGYCMAGLFIVIESWLLSTGESDTRGQVLAIYMIALYGAQAAGQFLLNLSDPESIIPFCIVTILSTLSVVPLSMTYAGSPKIEAPSALSFFKLYKISPSGVFGCFSAGLILGGIYGLLPLFVSQVYKSVSDVALLMGLTILGGMFLQYPVGRISDYFNRRNVIVVLSILIVVTSLLIMATAYVSKATLMLLLFVFGGFAFTLYPLSITYACDYVESEDIVAATQGLLLAYGVGATIGPFAAPYFIQVFGAMGLFIFFIIIAGSYAAYMSWRRGKKPRMEVAEQHEFMNLPRTTPVASELSPRAEESSESDEQYPM